MDANGVAYSATGNAVDRKLVSELLLQCFFASTDSSTHKGLVYERIIHRFVCFVLEIVQRFVVCSDTAADSGLVFERVLQCFDASTDGSTHKGLVYERIIRRFVCFVLEIVQRFVVCSNPAADRGLVSERVLQRFDVFADGSAYRRANTPAYPAAIYAS